MSILQANGAGLGGAGDPGGALAGGGILGSHAINQSLRFDGSAAYLSKNDFGTSTDVNKRTFSTWIKQSQVTFTTYDSIICAAASGIEGIIFEDTEKIGLIENASTYFSDALFRDPAAWYHIFFTFDHSAGEYKLYINGSLEKGISGATASTMDKLMNTGHLTTIMKRSNGSQYISGYLAETVALDGYIGDINDFGELVSGVWVPKEIDTSSITFGNNGFYLPFAQDVSGGNSINFGTGRTAKVTYSDASSYDIGASDDFTIEYFLKTQDVGANYGNFMGDYATGGPHHLISYDFRSSTRNINFYTGNGTTLTWAVAGDVTLSNGTWHHFVFQRDGTTLRAYIDGTRLTSVSGTSYTKSDGKVTNFNKDYNLSQIIIGDPHAQGMSGSLSNVRYVIGDTVYADDDSDITVPTATLTAVTGTKLLTAVNATLGDDISTENNDGSVSGATLSYDSPFTTSNFFDDASGNGNHFTANNLAVSDVVPDSPTNNFATYNPLVYSTATYAEGNLKFDAGGWSSTYWGSKSSFAIPKDKKIYIELEETATGGANYAVGIGTASSIPTSSNIGGTGSITLYHTEFKINGTSTAHGQGSSSAGDIIGIAVDGSTGEVWFSRNGTWFTTGGAGADPSTGTDPIGTVTNPDDEDLFLVVAGNTSTSNLFVNFGQDSTNVASAESDVNELGTFEYAVPTDHVCLCSSSLSEPTISPNSAEQADDYFNTVLWSGDNTASRAITGVGHAPDFVWIKTRNQANEHSLFDSVRGVAKDLESNSTAAEQANNQYGYINSFDSDGFTVVKGTNSNPALVNASGNTYTAWNWKAGGTAVSNTDGSITSSVSAAPDAGFAVGTYTGNATAGATIGHSLGEIPEMVIVKRRTNARDWSVYHKDQSATPTNAYLLLNSTAAVATGNTAWNNGTFTSSVFTIGSHELVNANTDSYVFYAFRGIEGYSAVGKYVGNANADGTFVFTGFRPAWVLLKDADSTSDWQMYDSKRYAFNKNNVTEVLEANESGAETTTINELDLLSNGFKLRSTNTFSNKSSNFIYLAFAEAPFKYANAR